METPTSLLPGQQQQGEALTNPEAVSTSSSQSSSGSIGPFFAVISVLAVLAFLSCVVGRRCTKGAVTPLESINYGGCLGWVRRKCQRRTAGSVEGGAKMAAFVKERNDCKVEDVEVQHPPQA